MKYVSYVAFCAILLCCSVVRSQSAHTLSADDVKFLSSCGALQDDVTVIPKLPSDGQVQIRLILASPHRKCSMLERFIYSRNYLRKFTPQPNTVPSPSPEWDANFVTSAELEYIDKVVKEILK